MRAVAPADGCHPLMEDEMPRQTIYTGPTLAIDKAGNEYPAEAVPEGAVVEYHVRGVTLSWGHDGKAVEIGVSLVDSAGTPRMGGHFTQLDRASAAALIKELQRASRAAFGADPW